MPRKKRTPPKFKVGDYVRLRDTEMTRLRYPQDILWGKPWQVRSMYYEARWEKNPSPWSCTFIGVPENLCDYEIFEEDLEHDVFLTAVHNALETKET